MPLGMASGLTVDARRNLYWFDNTMNQLMQLAEDVPAAKPVPLGMFDVQPDGGTSAYPTQGIVVDGQMAFIGMLQPTTGKLVIVEFSLCGATPVQLTAGGTIPGSIFQDSKAVYWGEYFGAIHKLAK
jgi:hypothetical protein